MVKEVDNDESADTIINNLIRKVDELGKEINELSTYFENMEKYLEGVTLCDEEPSKGES